jgi:AraC-like DNA-binding protein
MPNCTESNKILNSREKSYVYFLNTLKKLVKDFKYNELGFYEYDCDIKLHLAWAEETLKYIKEHLTEELHLETVANAMSLSPIHFHNTFKAAVGKTLRDYAEEQRIKKAINLLLTTNESLTQIAFACGFSSQSYFSYVFKRKMKVTPREYVREVYNKYEE